MGIVARWASVNGVHTFWGAFHTYLCCSRCSLSLARCDSMRVCNDRGWPACQPPCTATMFLSRGFLGVKALPWNANIFTFCDFFMRIPDVTGSYSFARFFYLPSLNFFKLPLLLLSIVLTKYHFYIYRQYTKKKPLSLRDMAKIHMLKHH